VATIGDMSDTANDEPCVSGALTCSLREVARDLLGAEVLTRALERVPPPVRTSFENAVPMGWVPIYVLETTFGEMAAEVGTTVAELHERVARRSIELTFHRFWRLLLRVTTDAALVSRTPAIFARSYNRGRIESRIWSPGRGEVKLTDWPKAPEWAVRGLRIGIEVALSVAGRRNVQASCTRTATGAVYVITWR
jgi:hypothetical protein